MKKYGLTEKNGEVINVTVAKNQDEATKIFSIIKQLNEEDLLKLFKVIEIEI